MIIAAQQNISFKRYSTPTKTTVYRITEKKESNKFNKNTKSKQIFRELKTPEKKTNKTKNKIIYKIYQNYKFKDI